MNSLRLTGLISLLSKGLTRVFFNTTFQKHQFFGKELYEKDLHDPDNQNGVITHLEPDILEWVVKWALGSITTNKASGGDGMPFELF